MLKFFKKRDVDLDREMRKSIIELTGSLALAQTFSGGVSRAMPPPFNVDLSQRVGVGKLLPDEAGGILGVSYDLWWKRPAQAVEHWEVDNYLLAMAEMTPKAFGDMLTAAAWGSGGVRTKAGDKVVIPREQVTGTMIAQKAAGFTPGPVAEVRGRERAEQRVAHSADEARSDFYRRMAKAQYAAREAGKAGDTETAREASAYVDQIWAEVRKWNAEHPQSEQIRLTARTRAENLKKEYQGADRSKGQRKNARAAIRELQPLYGNP